MMPPMTQHVFVSVIRVMLKLDSGAQRRQETLVQRSAHVDVCQLSNLSSYQHRFYYIHAYVTGPNFQRQGFLALETGRNFLSRYSAVRGWIVHLSGTENRTK